jgi:hypothetical protein
VVDVGLDALKVGTKRHRLFVARERPAIPATRPGKPVGARRQLGLGEVGVEQQGQPRVKSLGDQAAQQSGRVSADPADRAWALERAHIE